MLIPDYYRSRWEDFIECRYRIEAKKFEKLTGMKVDPRRSPFLSAGNLENPVDCPWILTFGLAPHSNKKSTPSSLLEYYKDSIKKFHPGQKPHPIHFRFAQICRGILGETFRDKIDPGWFNDSCYLSFDLVPYHIKNWEWKGLDREGQLLELIETHFKGCLDMLDNRGIGFAIFCGKTWGELLVDSDLPHLCSIDVDKSFPFFLKSKDKQYNKTIVNVGTINTGFHSFPAIIIPRSIHGRASVAFEDLWEIGKHIRTS